jgi:anti-sigma factor RsiW
VNEDLHTLAAPYALDALHDDHEMARFEEHLAGCPECEWRVRALAETTAKLGVAAARTPPPGLRARVFAEIGLESPPVSSPAPAPASRPVRVRGTGAWNRWLPRLALGLAAACLAVAVVSGIAAVDRQRKLDRVEAANRAVTAVLSAPDARATSGAVSSGGTVTIVTSRSRGRVVAAFSGLAPLPSSRTYELWMMGPGGARPAGLLRPDDQGRTTPIVTDTHADTSRVGLTVEPAGGSRQPTTTPIAVLGLPT